MDQLRKLLPPDGQVLEIASGSGQHACHFAAALAPLQWLPSDLDETAIASIEAYRNEMQLPNLLAPTLLDISLAEATAYRELNGIVCINMIHISPWSATQGLFAAAGAWLAVGAALISYGPYRFSGSFTAPSNHTFDAGLRHSDPNWGVRDIDDLRALAKRHNLADPEVIEMPANNHILAFRRQ